MDSVFVLRSRQCHYRACNIIPLYIVRDESHIEKYLLSVLITVPQMERLRMKGHARTYITKLRRKFSPSQIRMNFVHLEGDYTCRECTRKVNLRKSHTGAISSSSCRRVVVVFKTSATVNSAS